MNAVATIEKLYREEFSNAYMRLFNEERNITSTSAPKMH